MLLLLLSHSALALDPQGDDTTPAGALAGEDVYPPVLVPPQLIEAAPLPWPPGEPPTTQVVKLGLLIDRDGAVLDALALTGVPAFAESAVEAVLGFRFSPATLDGAPMMVQLPYELTFEPPPVNVSGLIELGGSQDPLPGISVRVGPFLAETDDQGRFEIRGLAPGEHTVHVVSPLWRAPDQVFTLAPQQRAELAIWVRPTGTVVEAVGVYQKSQGQIVIHTLTAEDVRTTPGTMGDPVRAVQNLPGLVHTPLESGWLLVRGGDPEDTGLLIDGIRVPLIYHLGGFTSVIHPSFVSQVDYLPGGYSARYGRSTAGVVDLKTASLEGVRARVEAGVDLINASIYSQFPMGDGGGGALAVRRSYLDRAIALVAGEDAAKIAPRFWDWQARADGKSGGVFVFGYSDEIDAPTGDGDQTVTITIGTQRFHGRLERSLSETTTLLLQPYGGLEWYNLELDTAQYRESTIGGLRAELERDAGEHGGLAGLDMELGNYDLRIDDNVADTGSGERVADTRYAALDPYLHLRWGWPDEARYELSFRLETLKLADQFWRVGASPRLGVSLPINQSLTLVGDFGIYHQPPPMDLMAAAPAGPSLLLEQSWGPGAGLRLQRGAIRYQLDGYWRELDRVTQFEDDGSLVQGEGIAYGVENMIRWTAGSLSGWTAYTWSRSWRREDTNALWQPHDYDQPHYLVQVLSWQLPRDWSLSTRWRVGSGYPWATSQTSVYDLLTQESHPLEPDIFLRLQPYSALDLKISKRVVFRAWRLEFYLDGQNLYNRRIPEPVITGIDDSSTWYSFGLPALPIFGVKGVFWP